MKTTIKSILIFIVCVLFLLIVILLSLSVINGVTDVASKSSAVSLEPTVIIDAGHGGEDGGAIGVTGVLEKDLNLSLSNKIGSELKSLGINVINTRTEDILLYDKSADYKNKKKLLDLAERVKIGNNTPNCIFVSIHMNSFSQSQYRGLQIYYSKNNQASYQLASCIQSAVKQELQPQNNRKVTEATSRIYLLDRLNCPAILIECGFISNLEECRLLSTEIYQKQLAKVISEEIANYVEKNS